jgi:hypothetical protein
MEKLLYIAALLLLPAIVAAEEIDFFTTDGCSAFPDGNIDQQTLWLGCCIQHDLAYWKGGTYEERLNSDQLLEQCVSKVGEPEIAKLMLAGVRVGGSPYFPTSFRWGYGWPYPRGYKMLSDNEKKQVTNKLQVLELVLQSISEELKSDGMD